MKICLYLEFYRFCGGILFKKVGTGLLSSYENQRAMLAACGIDYTDAWDDSCDILQINTPWLKSLWLIKRARARGKKVIIFSHVTAEDAKEVFWFGAGAFPWLKRYLTFAYGLANVIVSPTAYTKSLLVAYGLPAEKIIVQSNGVDLKKFFASESERASERNRYGASGLAVGTVGLVIPRKGVKTFLAAAENFPANQFFWFGKIYSRLLVKPLPRHLPANARFTGFVPNIRAAMNMLDIFIFPSVEENQGMAILEAAAIGLPILVRDLPAYRGWLQHGENCLKAASEDEFLKLLDSLLNDAALRKRLGENALKLARSEDVAKFGERLRSLYQRLLYTREPRGSGQATE